MSKPQDAWSFWTASLSAQAREAIRKREGSLAVEKSPEPSSDEADAYRDFGTALSPASLESMRSHKTRQPEPVSDDLVAHFHLVECRDGEWAVLRRFKTVDGLVRRIGQLEGEDVIVWPFFGVAMTMTKGPQRYLMLPDGERAIQIPMYDGGPARIVPADLLSTLEIQQDGYVGPANLATTKIATESLESKPVAKAKAKDDEEDEDEDD